MRTKVVERLWYAARNTGERRQQLKGEGLGEHFFLLWQYILLSTGGAWKRVCMRGCGCKEERRTQYGVPKLCTSRSPSSVKNYDNNETMTSDTSLLPTKPHAACATRSQFPLPPCFRELPSLFCFCFCFFVFVFLLPSTLHWFLPLFCMFFCFPHFGSFWPTLLHIFLPLSSSTLHSPTLTRDETAIGSCTSGGPSWRSRVGGKKRGSGRGRGDFCFVFVFVLCVVFSPRARCCRCSAAFLQGLGIYNPQRGADAGTLLIVFFFFFLLCEERVYSSSLSSWWTMGSSPARPFVAIWKTHTNDVMIAMIIMPTP